MLNLTRLVTCSRDLHETKKQLVTLFTVVGSLLSVQISSVQISWTPITNELGTHGFQGLTLCHLNGTIFCRVQHSLGTSPTDHPHQHLFGLVSGLNCIQQHRQQTWLLITLHHSNYSGSLNLSGKIYILLFYNEKTEVLARKLSATQ